MFEPSHPDFLELVRCPATQSRLTCLPESSVLKINERIQAGDVFNQIGKRVEQELESVLVNGDHTLLVPVREGIVTLLVDELIPANQFELDLTASLGVVQ
jgi:uncharacterized protein YbaR (Trm112 family)